jgi:hypothetical protein
MLHMTNYISNNMSNGLVMDILMSVCNDLMNSNAEMFMAVLSSLPSKHNNIILDKHILFMISTNTSFILWRHKAR